METNSWFILKQLSIAALEIINSHFLNLEHLNATRQRWSMCKRVRQLYGEKLSLDGETVVGTSEKMSLVPWSRSQSLQTRISHSYLQVRKETVLTVHCSDCGKKLVTNIRELRTFPTSRRLGNQFIHQIIHIRVTLQLILPSAYLFTESSSEFLRRVVRKRLL